jgi:hypothetical protein
MDCAADDPSPLSTACPRISWRRTGEALTPPPRGALTTADGKPGRSAAVRRHGGWFCARTDAATDASALTVGAKPPAALKRGLIVRLPPFGHQEAA